MEANCFCTAQPADQQGEFYSALSLSDTPIFSASKGLDGFAKTGIRSRQRRSRTMRCCFTSICTTTASR